MMDKYYFYQSYYDALKGLKPTTRYAIRDAIDRYMFEDIEPTFKDTLSNSIWMLLLPTLKLSKVRYANGKQTKSKDEAKPKQNESKTVAKLEQTQSKPEGNPQVCPSISKDKGERKKDKGDIPPISPKGVVSASFEKFWKAYPRHEMKQRAIKALERALTKTDIDTILNAIEKQKDSMAWRKDNGKFIPHPASWLNGGGWDNDVEDVVILEKPKKPVPEVNQCPECGSYDLGKTLDRVMCRGCGAIYDYNHTSGKWEKC